MGKRKSRADPNKTPPSDVLPQSSQMEGSSQQRSSGQVESGKIGSISSIVEIVDDSIKMPQVSQVPAHHHHCNRAVLYKNPRYCSRKYHRRNLVNHADVSTSRANVNPPVDESIFFELANKYCSYDSGQHSEGWDRAAFLKPERIRSNSFGTDAASSSHGVGKMACGICERPLRKKLHASGGVGPPLSDLSAVAVLVCGHVFHADCLEQKTCQAAQMDPPCPLCPGPTSQVDASVDCRIGGVIV